MTEKRAKCILDSDENCCGCQDCLMLGILPSRLEREGVYLND